MSLGPTDEFVIDDSQRMTVNGTINKTGIMLMIVVAVGAWAWNYSLTNLASAQTILYTGLFGGLISGLVVAFKPNIAHIGTPIYAVFKGLFLGTISAFFEMRYPGIVMQAVGLTLAVMFAMLFSYRTGLIKVTETFKKVVIFATMGIALFYLVSLVAYFVFGAEVSYFNTENASMFSIGLSFVIVGIAALNLVLDFDFIEQGAANNMPKQMEWYGAFGLLVTILWLYIELLRLLAKLRE
ncbi:Bax inhibitor-1/YccA family protein [Marinicella sp. W31]|uniref:Bax inhibitor-1/YccA family protein n=1 Tax=Marinicella sp. W31 TaxID=3023713 RepID=UPI0037579F78